MTREELKTATNDALIYALSYCGYTSYYRDYRDDIIVEIKKRMQDSILNKIRAEIIDTRAYEQEIHGKTEFLDGINYCLEVIDKYKARSEVE
ncbi:hypothetical protein SAMN05216391_10817 [Lachnospiraceae bacterium KHCPX20]|nr:hypothetical protein SAMN05216391_10817 [Lachnospiraceae bacterium KHCPX20]